MGTAHPTILTAKNLLILFPYIFDFADFLYTAAFEHHVAEIRIVRLLIVLEPACTGVVECHRAMQYIEGQVAG